MPTCSGFSGNSNPFGATNGSGEGIPLRGCGAGGGGRILGRPEDVVQRSNPYGGRGGRGRGSFDGYQQPFPPAAVIRANRICPVDACGPPACNEPITFCPTLISSQQGLGSGRCPKKGRRRATGGRKRIDKRIYRNGEHLCLTYAGHIPGEQFIHGRTLPVATTFTKRRLKTYTPYEFVDPDGCCSFP